MVRNAANRKFENLCSRYGAAIKIIGTTAPEAPKYSIREEGRQAILMVNYARIPADRYESYLGYYVSKYLLPRLILSTERLILRRFRPEDVAACYPFLSDPEAAYMDCSKAYTSIDEDFEDLMEDFAQQDTRYIIALKETGKVIGTVSLFEDNSRAVESMEIGYTVSPEYQRKGYAFEAVSALLSLLQTELMFDMVVAGVLPENVKSIGLLEKLGFQKEGMRRKAIWHEGIGKPVDLVYYYRDRES